MQATKSTSEAALAAEKKTNSPPSVTAKAKDLSGPGSSVSTNLLTPPSTAVPKGTSESLTNISDSVSAQKSAVLSSMDALDEKHKLAVSDRLSFRIMEDQEDPRESLDPKALIIADSGEVEIPYIGRVAAEGKTCKQLAGEIKAALEKEYYYKATVILAVDFMAKSRGKVYVVGPVRMPGPQEIPSDEVFTLSKAILRAGGFTDFADKRKVKITRNRGTTPADKQSFVVDVSEVLDKGRTERDITLEVGDLIVVPERLIRF